MSCASHGSHEVSPLGFVLLEEVEGSFGTSEQEILTAETFYRLGGLLREPLLSALGPRASCQSWRIETVHEKIFVCTSQKQAEAFLAISQNCISLRLSCKFWETLESRDGQHWQKDFAAGAPTMSLSSQLLSLGK